MSFAAKYEEETTLTWNTIRKHIGGTIKHFQNGKLHREDGPAIIRPDHRPSNTMSLSRGATAIEEWYKNGKRHREDGPALTWSCGKTIQEEYWNNGKRTGIKGDRFFGMRENWPPRKLDLGPLER